MIAATTKTKGVPIVIPETANRLCLSVFINLEKSAINTGKSMVMPIKAEMASKSDIF